MNSHAVNPHRPNAFQRFYGGQTFDVLFGLIPAVLMILFCLFVIQVTAGRPDWTAMRWIPVKYLFALSVCGLTSCGVLVLAMLNSRLINDSTKRLYILILRLGLANVLVILALLMVTFVLNGLFVFTLSLPLVLLLPLSIAAIKQINLLKSSEFRRRL